MPSCSASKARTWRFRRREETRVLASVSVERTYATIAKPRSILGKSLPAKRDETVPGTVFVFFRLGFSERFLAARKIVPGTGFVEGELLSMRFPRED
jgi:hypothetical protein